MNHCMNHCIFIMHESVVTHLSSSCLSFTVPSCLNLTSLHAMSVAVYMQYELHLIVQTVTELSRADRKLAASFLTLISTQMSDLSAVPNISLVCKAWVVTDPRYRDCVCVYISSYGSLKL